MKQIVRQITGSGVVLETEAFGQQGQPALVLIMGATASMLGWPDAFCTALADQGRFVIRFDHRDTGRSTTFPPGPPAYSVEDMAADVFAVMDGWGIGQADVLGMSLGGYIGQVAALSKPDRVRSLTLIASEPLGWDGPGLPGIAPAFLDHFSQIGALDWQDRKAVASVMLQTSRLCHVTMAPEDEVATSQIIAREQDRTTNLQSAFNHGMVALAGDWTGMARQITCPALILHGDLDPILPPANGRALASTIPGARLHELAGMGHALPTARIPEITGVIGGFLAQISASPSAQT